MSARNLDGVLDRLGTRGQEQALLVARNRGNGIELLGEFDERRIGRYREAGMGEGIKLLLHPLHHGRMAMAGIEHRDAAAEIDIAAALDIPQFGILGARRDHWSGHAHAARHRFGAPFNPSFIEAFGRCLHVHVLVSSGIAAAFYLH